jgi:hypothetical protein
VNDRRAARLALATLILSGCGSVPITGHRVPLACEFPDDVLLSFAGETTMADLYIPAPACERDIVYAWVTAVPIHAAGGKAFRMACVKDARGQFEHSTYPGSLYRESD